jgi:hypothetical protein
MKKPDILDHVNDPRYIPGIYNYCDRWCERCSYKTRCLNYEMSHEKLEDLENESMENEKFWENMHDVFQETFELIDYVAKEQGIDLNNIEPDPEFEKKEEEIEKAAKQHELSIKSEKYYKIVDKWFKEEFDTLKQKEEFLNKNLEMGINEKAAMQAGNDIGDAIDVIKWYMFQIHVKFMRALSNKKELYDFDEEDDFPSDADGSVKVALLGIDRSIAAWKKLHDHFEEKADDILDIILLLDRLRRKAEQCFPKARAFVRPGFDTDDSPVYKGK